MTAPSPDLSAEDWFDLDYCAPLGIPLSIFRGRAPAPGEPQWTKHDRWVARLWQARQNRRCEDCGQDLSVSTLEENTFGYRAEPDECHSCRAIHRAAMKLTGTTTEDPLAGIRYTFTRTPETAA